MQQYTFQFAQLAQLVRLETGYIERPQGPARRDFLVNYSMVNNQATTAKSSLTGGSTYL